MQSQFDAPEQALAWVRKGHKVAIATVVQTWGSAPRQTGAQLVIADDGAMEGSVSGGCVEGAVVLEAQEAIETGQSKRLEYGVSDGDAFAVGLACGGTIKILVEPVTATGLSPAILQELVDARAARRPVAYVTSLTRDARQLVYEGFEAQFRSDRSGVTEDGDTFVGIHNPPLRLVIVGGVHIAQHLVQMAGQVGFDPFVVDPRESFASAQRFPQAKLINDWPDDALDQIGLDRRCAVVLLTHDPKLDDPALRRALQSDAFYIGALGSRRTHASRVERMSEAGFDATVVARVHGPVGLNIGAAGPAEIAVSTLAEIIKVLRSP